MAAHRLRIDYDAQTGEIKVRHTCETTLAGHTCTHTEDVALADPDSARAALAALVATNKAEMEGRAEASAITHVAAVTARRRPHGTGLAVGGSVGAFGLATDAKNPPTV